MIGAVELAGVDQRHEQIAHPRAVQGFVEQRVLPVQDCFLQSSLDDTIGKLEPIS